MAGEQNGWCAFDNSRKFVEYVFRDRTIPSTPPLKYNSLVYTLTGEFWTQTWCRVCPDEFSRSTSDEQQLNQLRYDVLVHPSTSAAPFLVYLNAAINAINTYRRSPEYFVRDLTEISAHYGWNNTFILVDGLIQVTWDEKITPASCYLIMNYFDTVAVPGTDEDGVMVSIGLSAHDVIDKYWCKLRLMANKNEWRPRNNGEHSKEHRAALHTLLILAKGSW